MFEFSWIVVTASVVAWLVTSAMKYDVLQTVHIPIELAPRWRKPISIALGVVLFLVLQPVGHEVRKLVPAVWAKLEWIRAQDERNLKDVQDALAVLDE